MADFHQDISEYSPKRHGTRGVEPVEQELHQHVNAQDWSIFEAIINHVAGARRKEPQHT
jgi:hypothetical protein